MGALDLGGASTQISFIPEDSQENFNSTLQVKLYGYNYNVYTHSFQCYGRDEAEKRLLALLLQVCLSSFAVLLFHVFSNCLRFFSLCGVLEFGSLQTSLWWSSETAVRAPLCLVMDQHTWVSYKDPCIC